MVDRTHGETKLWESFIKGETAAFEEVYRRYYSLLYSYGIRMVGDRELVADTIQNLFVKLILNCRNLHYTDNVKDVFALFLLEINCWMRFSLYVLWK